MGVALDGGMMASALPALALLMACAFGHLSLSTAASGRWPPHSELQGLDGGRANYDFTRVEGFITAGSDIDRSDHTVDKAKKLCDANEFCMGFTFSDPDGEPKPEQVVTGIYFKSKAETVPAPGWISYVKTTPPEYPEKNFTAGGLKVGLRSGSHTVQVLGLENDDMPPYNFSFVPPLKGFNRPTRTVPRCHHLGDITLRVRPASMEPRGGSPAENWAMYSSATAAPPSSKATPLEPSGPGVFAADDITALVESSLSEQPFPLGLRVTRSFESSAALNEDGDGSSGGLVIRWNLTNAADASIRVGGLGFTIPSDASTANMQLQEIAHTNSFADPHIGGDHAFVEWLRVVGNRSMLVVPHTRSAKMEAWRPVMEDCQFDGEMSEWTVLSAAWAEEWELNQQAPIWEMDKTLADTGVWPEPKSPWPSWHGNETMRLRTVQHWNPPTFLDLAPGEEVSFALRFVLGKGGPRTRDSDLRDAGVVSLHAVPGYTIATDMSGATLLVTPPSAAVGVESVVSDRPDVLAVGTLSLAGQGGGGYVEVPVKGLKRGRTRVVVRMTDGSEAIAHYHVLPPFHEQVARLGRHWSTTAWLPREFPDPFGRSASVMPWDREDQRHILQDSRAYIVGLSDDAGAANNLGFATKVNFAPLQEEVSRVDEYIKWTLYGVKPDVAKPPLRSLQDPETDGIRMTLFYYPDPLPTSNAEDHTAAPPPPPPPSAAATGGGGGLRGNLWQQPLSPAAAGSAWPPSLHDQGHSNFPYEYTEANKCHMPVGGPIWCMIETMANATYRGYNNPHQTAVYYAMYRVARNYDRMKFEQPWQWYLERAWKTMKSIGSAGVGLMDGTIFREVLLALQEEGVTNTTIAGFAQEAETNMRARADQWAQQTFPYGSEFNFDTTGQEEVFIWLTFFNYTEPAARTRDAVLGYMRSLPNWAWNGGSRSMGDLGNNGKWFINRGTERGLMHYRSGLNMIPLIEAYRSDPDDHLLLEISMGAMTGQMANIDETGATSMMFHSFPFVNDYDPHSGDYGLGFFGHSLQAGAYYVNHPTWGPRCYLCDLRLVNGEALVTEIVPKDSYRQRVFLEPLGLYIVARTGRIARILLDMATRRLSVQLVPDVASSSDDPHPKHNEQHISYKRPGTACDSRLEVPSFSRYSVQVQKMAASRPGSRFRPLNPTAVAETIRLQGSRESTIFRTDPEPPSVDGLRCSGGGAQLSLTWDSDSLHEGHIRSSSLLMDTTLESQEAYLEQ